MLVDRERFLLLAAALAACHQVARQSASQLVPQNNAPVVTPAAQDAQSAPAAQQPTFCEALVKQNAEVLANPKGSCPNYPDQERAAREELARQESDSFFRFCHEGKGVWAVVVVSVELDDAPTGEAEGCGWQASYELVHAHEPPALVKSTLRSWDHHPNSTQDSHVDAVFDYDADGKDELLLSTHSWWNGGGGGATLEVLRADESGVKKFDIRFPYDATVDADRDGRPDLIASTYFATTCEGMDVRPINGASILWHSLPNGTFSSSDEVARRWALRQCPPNSTSSSDTSDEGCAIELSCQRIWGRSASVILKGAASLPVCANSCVDKKRAVEIISPPLPYKALNVDTPR